MLKLITRVYGKMEKRVTAPNEVVLYFSVTHMRPLRGGINYTRESEKPHYEGAAYSSSCLCAIFYTKITEMCPKLSVYSCDESLIRRKPENPIKSFNIFDKCSNDSTVVARTHQFINEVEQSIQYNFAFYILYVHTFVYCMNNIQITKNI